MFNIYIFIILRLGIELLSIEFNIVFCLAFSDMQNKCDAGEMKFSTLESGENTSLAERKAVVRVAASIG